MPHRPVRHVGTLACALLLGPAAPLAQTAAPLPGGPGMAEPRLVGVATGEPEKDSYGVEGGGGPGCRPVFSREARLLGPSLGDEEKDSIGFEVAGQEGCPSAPPP